MNLKVAGRLHTIDCPAVLSASPHTPCPCLQVLRRESWQIHLGGLHAAQNWPACVLSAPLMFLSAPTCSFWTGASTHWFSAVAYQSSRWSNTEL